MHCMDLKSIVLAAAIGIGYAVPAEAARITKGKEHSVNPDIGHRRVFREYTILSEKGDTLESIAAQIVQRKITGFEGSPYTPARVYQLVLQQLQRNYPVNQKLVLSTGTILRYDQTTDVRRGFNHTI